MVSIYRLEKNMAENKTAPAFLYGTAWKEETTRELTLLALENGFRGIDTANQRKHYFEAAVGEGIAEFLKRNEISREDLFLQTKFTYQAGQDHRLPYNPEAAYSTQVEESFASSLEALHAFLSSVKEAPQRLGSYRHPHLTCAPAAQRPGRLFLTRPHIPRATDRSSTKTRAPATPLLF